VLTIGRELTLDGKDTVEASNLQDAHHSIGDATQYKAATGGLLASQRQEQHAHSTAAHVGNFGKIENNIQGARGA